MMSAALKDKKYPIIDPMSETQMAAMFVDAKLNATQEEAIMRHLRIQFGAKAFASRSKVRMLGHGHTSY
jgi:hypothetical protein